MAIPERLGSFYLGRIFDQGTGKVTGEPVMYDARDLTTHAVCVGMTGSGKTGLCIDLLEEAALDKVPVIAIDPKGDITNLLLTFPDLAPSDFLPWVNLDDARRKGLTPEAYAAKTAEQWRKGLEEWGQGTERIRLLRDSADFTIYTPGSDAGTPVSVLSALTAPGLDWDMHAEALRERVAGTVSALLGLAGVEGDPLRSREHILLSHIVEHAWRAGHDLDVAGLIRSIQDPPMRQLGVFDIETFFPARDRFELAMRLNAIVASPSFASWLTGAPLDIDQFLYGGDATPNVSIFSIAHLTDSERMFFVTLLLEQLVTWVRRQPGTTSLRALLYMDEVFGFFPPIGEPPSKKPLLTLLKQARAFGLGVVLTTQNPVDLDYKGLSNAGTWFVGKLQAERDKDRLLDGLEGAATQGGVQPKRSELERMITSLGSRCFLLHNVHEGAPKVFMTRWAMSYLRGPLTRRQIKELAAAEGGAEKVFVEAGTRSFRMDGPPSLPPDVDVVYLSGRSNAGEGLTYRGGVLGMATVHFVDTKRDVHEQEEVVVWVPLEDGSEGLRWRDGEALHLEERDLEDAPASGGRFEDVPAEAVSARALKGLHKKFSDHLYRSRSLTLYYNPSLKLYSRPGESERNFKVSCQLAARERRDAEVDALTDRYQDRIERVRVKLRKEEIDLEEDRSDYESRKREELVSAGESILGLFLGRRSSRSLSTAARKRRMTSRAKHDILESEQSIAVLKGDIADLERELTQAAEDIEKQWESAVDEIKTYEVRPRRADVVVHRVALAWKPLS